MDNLRCLCCFFVYLGTNFWAVQVFVFMEEVFTGTVFCIYGRIFISAVDGKGIPQYSFLRLGHV